MLVSSILTLMSVALAGGRPPPPSTPMVDLTAAQHAELRPRHHLLPQKPYGHIDFTAYTLEWGEVRMGLARIDIGVLPRTQLGTVPALDAAGVYNGAAKVDVVRLGPLDLGLRGQAFYFPQPPTFDALWLDGGVTASLRLARPWSVHASGAYARVRTVGIPDLSGVVGLVWPDGSVQWTQPDLDGELRLTGEAATVRLATDVRFNRRDSVVLQGQAVVWARLRGELPQDLEIARVIGLDRERVYGGWAAVQNSYVASLAYQASFRMVELRVGAGVSAVPYTWVLQSVELAYRFGGKTRWREGRMRRGWRRNKHDIGGANDRREP